MGVVYPEKKKPERVRELSERPLANPRDTSLFLGYGENENSTHITDYSLPAFHPI